MTTAQLVNSVNPSARPLARRLPVRTQGRTLNHFRAQATQHTLRDADRAGRMEWLRRIKTKDQLLRYFAIVEPAGTTEWWEEGA